MSNKIIQVNTELFKQPRSTNKKIKTKNNYVVSPNTLKRKLITRIHQHKNKENVEQSKESLGSNTEIAAFSDEFNESMHYLESLSKKQELPVNDMSEKFINDDTLKSSAQMFQAPMVFLDLPFELSSASTIGNVPRGSVCNNDVPYGVMKNGNKPTFREWNKTLKRKEGLIAQSPIVIVNKPEPEIKLRELKLNQLIETRKGAEEALKEECLLVNAPNKSARKILPDPDGLRVSPDSECESSIKRYKKTTKTKYTVGKNDKSRKISILLKNSSTRKQILSAQKELKREDINKMKEYLRNHNLIKVGSCAPTDVIRRLYESALMSGDIRNVGKENLIHNFIEGV